MSHIRNILAVSLRESRRILSSPLYIFSLVGAPLLCFVFFLTLMGKGLPSGLPVGVVDMDRSAQSRSVVRNLGAFQHIKIVARYRTFNEARDQMQRGRIYGVFYIPAGFSRDLQNQQQPTISYYSNYTYLIAGTLSFRDFRMMSELAAGAAGRAVLTAKGATDDQAQEFLQPIVVDTHLLGNPWLNYSVYLNNITLPGALMIMVFLLTVYSIGVELKDKTAYKWISLSGNSIFNAVTGKLLPYTAVFFLMALVYNLLLYGVLRFPCHCGMPVMVVVSFGRFLRRAAAAFPLCHECGLAVGNTVAFDVGIYVSRYRDVAAAERLVGMLPPAPLFPYLRRPGPERLSPLLLLGRGAMAHVVPAASANGALPPERRAAYLQIRTLK